MTTNHILKKIDQEIEHAPYAHHHQEASQQNPGKIGIASRIEEKLLDKCDRMKYLMLLGWQRGFLHRQHSISGKNDLYNGNQQENLHNGIAVCRHRYIPS